MTAPPTARAVVEIPLGRLRHHPDNVRRSLGDLRDLTGSIRQLGVLQPLIVERRGDSYRILAGHRRHTAARLAGLRTVPCVITAGVDEVTALGLMLTENLQRADLTREEKAAAVRALRDQHGLTVAQVAARLGVAPSTVYGWLHEPRPVPAAALAPPPAAPSASAAAPLPTPVTQQPSTVAPPQPPALSLTRAARLHGLVRAYDTAPARSPAAAGVARALRDEVAALLGGWTPPTTTRRPGAGA